MIGIYLGDGVFASWNGSYILLHINEWAGEPRKYCTYEIAIEASVMRKLMSFAKEHLGEPTDV
jgi:hypothetical protein